ncbi:MAG: hypothetical protein ACI970_000354 [Myxococcota bacterium]|jgi:hypothetical protein
MPIEDVIGGQPWPPKPVRVVPLDLDAGVVAGHRLWVRSIECWGGWMDVRVARVDETGERPLPRRLPPPGAWQAWLDGEPLTVADAVGRGDRRFSDGELRLRPGLPTLGGTLTLTAELLPGEVLRIDVPIPPA